MNFREVDLRRLNSATKYPSIPTLHALGNKGRLTDEVLVDFTGHKTFVSEKVDGTNSRVIITSKGDAIVGSRNDLLWYSKDLLSNPAQGIVEVIAPIISEFPLPDPGKVYVYFGESFGGKIGGQAKQYSKTGIVDFRLFDVIEFTEEALAVVLKSKLEDISAWRERGEQPFLPTTVLEEFSLSLTPRLPVDGEVPTDHEGVLAWLHDILPETRCRLDDSGLGKAEGVVIRTEDRSRIAKARFQDYERTLRKR